MVLMDMSTITEKRDMMERDMVERDTEKRDMKERY